MPDIWELVSALVKFLLYLGVLGSTGLVLVRVVFRGATDQMRGPICRQASWLALLGVLGAGFGFVLQGAALTGEASGMVDPEMLDLLWRTPAGTRLVVLGIGLALLLGGLWATETGIWVAAAGGILALWSFSRVGHVSEAESLWLGLVLLVHLAGVAFWIGILSPLRRLASDARTLSDAATLGLRFGQIATVTVPMLIAAGVIVAWRLLGDISVLVMTVYGLTLLGKIVAVGVLLACAAANKFRFVPALSNGDPAAAVGLRRSIALEWIAVCAILLITAALTGGPNLPS